MTHASDGSRTLVLVNHPNQQKREDFVEIAAKIAVLAPNIDVQIAHADNSADQLPEHVWTRPCLTVSFGRLSAFRPKRGLIYCCRPIPKWEQLVKLHRAAIPVPLTAELTFGKPLRPEDWGPLVVLKPTTPGYMSQGRVYLMRTTKVWSLAGVLFPPESPMRRTPVLVQQFIDTGEIPSYYRVLALFGEPLYCRQGFATKPRPPLDAPDHVLLEAKIATNAEFGKGRPADDPDVLSLAKRTYAAMPAIPLHAVDIVRERSTGRLFVLETNPGGNTWHFSSKFLERHLRASTTREERICQFGAWDVAARVLIEKTLQRAR